MSGRRVTLLFALLTAGYAAAAPWAFILGPLALLLLISHPRTFLEWFWIGTAVFCLAFALRTHAGLVDQTTRASGLFFAGAFVVSALFGIPSLINRALGSVALAAAATVGWSASLHIRFADLQAELVKGTWEIYRAFDPTLPASPVATDTSVIAAVPGTNLATDLSAAMMQVTALYPGQLALLALVGGWLAWVWYHRLSRTPIGLPPQPFRNFRFNDHIIWVLVLLAAAALTPTPELVGIVVANALLVVLGLYAGRGLAVVQTALFALSPIAKIFLVALSIPLLLLVLGGCIILGVADTWVDFRRRIASATGALQ